MIKCYKCKYRQKIPNSTNSECTCLNRDKLNIEAEQYGIDKGWFNWPNDFDPMWLKSCDGFKEANHE